MSDGSREARPLQTKVWGEWDGRHLQVDGSEREIQMANSQGTGTPLVRSRVGGLGADLIRFAAGEGVGTHTHVGEHVLTVLLGEGEVIYDGRPYPLRPGMDYLVESEVPHAIYAGSDGPLVLHVVGDNHRGLADPARMEPVIDT